MAATAAAERARGMEPACAAAPAAAAARAATVPVAREPTVARREGSMVAAGGRNLVLWGWVSRSDWDGTGLYHGVREHRRRRRLAAGGGVRRRRPPR
jgi:hypothetical protein